MTKKFEQKLFETRPKHWGNYDSFSDIHGKNTIKLGYNEQDWPFLFVKTGVYYNRVNLCGKMTNLT
jgi:hypothetical protein